jgi:hypothetical protein
MCSYNEKRKINKKEISDRGKNINNFKFHITRMYWKSLNIYDKFLRENKKSYRSRLPTTILKSQININKQSVTEVVIIKIVKEEFEDTKGIIRIRKSKNLFG